MAGRLRTVLKVGAALLTLVLVAATGGYFWAKSATARRFQQRFTTHTVSFPVPFPLTDQEIQELRASRVATAEAPPAGDAAAVDVLAGVDLNAIALERAAVRGKHLTHSRYVCIECHGANFSGGMMIDDGLVGHIFGPNLTGGQGSRQGAYTVSDWDRSVRHGVRPDGTPAIMPSDDFRSMSDHELSDIIAYIHSLPKVDRQMPAPVYGPLLTVLIAAKEVPLSAEMLPHETAHVVEPPLSSDTLAFGKHLAQVCAGCHNAEFTGGPIPGAPPDWAPAGNLTRKGAGGWKYEAFEKVLRTGVKPDGVTVKVPMTIGVAATKLMTDEEIKALFAYFSSLPAKDPKL